ncbi:MAG: AsmA family protein, partial [Deltaproteobacteria bacterium]|nr:AsmA family protein [Deltaproteobacteria bacterium]
MTRWKKITLIAVGVLAVLVLLAATALPVLIRNKAVEALKEATGRNVRIEKVSLNPLTLTASVTGFAVEEKGGGPFFSVGSLRVSVSPASIYRRALVLSEVSIESPSVRVVREAADRFNFSDILERQKKTEEKPKSAGVFPFVLNRFQLTGGAFELDDRIVGGGRKH